MCELIENPRAQNQPQWDDNITAPFQADDIASLHRSLPGYSPTPLVKLSNLARELGTGSLYVKDESHRFDLKAFKSLGASYAIFHFLKEKWETATGTPFTPEFFHSEHYRDRLGSFTFCTATDGNHGRAVAWTARLLGEKAVIYMPADSAAARAEAIHSEGAEVVLLGGSYDDCVSRAQQEAAKHGWQVISDTSYAGYSEIPRYIMAGYTTMFREIDDALTEPEREFDFIFVQAGVGALLAAAAWYFTATRKKRPKVIAVEPTQAACVAESIRAGNLHTATGSQKTIMAGLNCGTVSLIAWPFIESGVDAVLTIGDDHARVAMRKYYYPNDNDPKIISGESGAAGLGALLALRNEPSLAEARNELGLIESSKILLLNTEGDTDPVAFLRIVES